jgi:hypothetical protein
MTDTPQNGPDRLDSWKAIAAYLQRDERTVRRWEREQGLPVRRVPGGRGTSVFAYVSEIEAWLRTTTPPPAQVDTAATVDTASDAPTAPPPPRRLQGLAWVAAALLLAAGVIASRAALHLNATETGLTVTLTTNAIVARDAGGRERWRHLFPGERVEAPGERNRHPVEILGGRRPEIVGATGLQVSVAHETVGGGQLLSFTPRGTLSRTFSFDDRLAFGAGVYERPWGITDFRVDEHAGGRRIALAAHHVQWWPSMVTILDDQWHRHGTFVNAGWLERVHWLSPDRLLVGGFFEPGDGGVVALLDAHAIDGQSPVSPDSRFYCTACGNDRPIQYVVMPRSEINRVTASRFNRARLEIRLDAIVARTIEASPTETDAVDALYEYTPSLDLVGASYSAGYWELHRSLEAQGKLNHTREQCPDRDGPREIRMWEPQTGWRTVTVPRMPSGLVGRGR